MSNIILSAQLKYLINGSAEQFSESNKLHQNSNDWSSYISVGNATYYKFLTNGVIKWHTTSKLSGGNYEQILKIDDFRKMESPLLMLFLLGYDEKTLMSFIEKFFELSNARVTCNCPAHLYQGSAYNLTELKSNYGDGEYRFPRIKDPEQKNLVCKHMWVVLQNFNEQIDTYIKNLLPYYKRYFGIQSPTGIERLRKELGEKGIRQMVATAIKDIKILKDTEMSSNFEKLTNNRLNDLFSKNIEENKEQSKKIEQEQNNNKEEQPKEQQTSNTDNNKEEIKEEETKEENNEQTNDNANTE